jgi:hypothetical protein
MGEMAEPGFVRLCQEKERSHLFGGRLCWQIVVYSCAKCGKRLCAMHAQFIDDAALCAACAATPR